MTQETNPRAILILASGDASLGTTLAAALAGQGHRITLATSPGAAVTAEDGIRPVIIDDIAADLEAEAKTLLETAGPVDTLIFANFAHGSAMPVEAIPSSVWSESLRRNTTLTFLLSRAAVPMLRHADEPRMLFLVPEQVRGMPAPGEAAFIAAKAALIGLMRTYALELGPDGITVNAIACEVPGAPPANRTTLTPRQPAARDAADAAAFFLSPASNFITGKTLDVNGGRSML